MPDLRRNLKRNGIEVYFPAKPEQAIIDWLKSHKFRWGRTAGVWWKLYKDDAWREVHEYFEQPLPVVEIPASDLANGIEIEKEHTSDVEQAKKIAMDHINENPKYYSDPKPKDWGVKELKKESMQKEFWQMTGTEYREYWTKKYEDWDPGTEVMKSSSSRRWYANRPDGSPTNSWPTKKLAISRLRDEKISMISFIKNKNMDWEHKAHIEKALTEKKPVPAEVLSEYPDIQGGDDFIKKHVIMGTIPKYDTSKSINELATEEKIRNYVPTKADADHIDQVLSRSGTENFYQACLELYNYKAGNHGDFPLETGNLVGDEFILRMMKYYIENAWDGKVVKEVQKFDFKWPGFETPAPELILPPKTSQIAVKPLPVTIEALVKCLKDLAGNDDNRPSMKYVYRDDSGVTVSDAYVLVHIPTKLGSADTYYEPKDASIFNPSINSKFTPYPNYKAVIPKDFVFSSAEINIEELMRIVAPYENTRKIIKTASDNSRSTFVRVRLSDHMRWYDSYKIYQVADALYCQGTRTVTLNYPETKLYPLVFIDKDAPEKIGLVMPLDKISEETSNSFFVDLTNLMVAGEIKEESVIEKHSDLKLIDNYRKAVQESDLFASEVLAPAIQNQSGWRGTYNQALSSNSHILYDEFLKNSPALEEIVSKANSLQEYAESLKKEINDAFKRIPGTSNRKTYDTLDKIRMIETYRNKPSQETKSGPEYFTKENAPENIKGRFGVAKKGYLDKRDGVPKRFIEKMPDGESLYAVDGKYVRDYIYSDFSQGGNDMAYPEFVPIGELWYEELMENEKGHIIKHEKGERDLMVNAWYTEEKPTVALTYEEAHEVVKKLEDNERGQKPETMTDYDFEKGNIIVYKPEYRAKNEDEKFRYELIEDPDGGRVKVKAIDTGLKFPPIEIAQLSQIQLAPTAVIKADDSKYVILNQNVFGTAKGSIGKVISKPNPFVTLLYFGKNLSGQKLEKKIDNTYLDKINGTVRVMTEGLSEVFVLEVAELDPGTTGDQYADFVISKAEEKFNERFPGQDFNRKAIVANWIKTEREHNMSRANQAIEEIYIKYLPMSQWPTARAALKNEFDKNNNPSPIQGLTKDQEAEKLLKDLQALRKFVSGSQIEALMGLIRSDDRQAGLEIIDKLIGIINTMPHLYQTEEIKTDDKIVYLHYFRRESAFYIVERNMAAVQHEAFGYSVLNGDYQMAEWGYVSIVELIQNNIELDFYWTPKPFSEVKKKWEPEEKSTKSRQEFLDGLHELDLWQEFEGRHYRKFILHPGNERAVLDLGIKEQLKDVKIGGKDYLSAIISIPAIGTSLEDEIEAAYRENTGIKTELSPAEVIRLPRVMNYDKEYFVDFKLQQLRDVHTAEPVPFTDIYDEELKAKIRGIRAEFGPNVAMPGLDDTKTVPKTEETVPEPSISVIKADYSSEYDLNKAIEKLLDKKWTSKREDFSEEELEFIKGYTGFGGLDDEVRKAGDKFDSKSFFEYFTPEQVIEKMWGLAYKFGYKDGPILEPSCGIGVFFDRRFVSNTVEKHGYEINKYSARIAKLSYPEAIINDGEEIKYFEQLFIINNYTVRNKVTPKYKLVIGNPPYMAIGKYGVTQWLGMGEKAYTSANNYIDYFIFRGLDLLERGGLLIYIIGAETAGGGVPFLDQGMNKVKELIMEKGKLIDAYRLPSGVFSRTDVTSDIVVFRKR
jgi:hypothetical protein